MSKSYSLKRASKKEKSPVPTSIDLNVTHLETPIIQGYLYKKSHLFDSFNRRYFILYTGCLVYYAKQEDFNKDISHDTLKNRLGFIKLNRIYLTKPDKKPHGGRYCFNLHTPDPANKRKEILLVSKTREERSDWMILLQQQNPHLVSPEQMISPDTPLPQRRRAHSTPGDMSLLAPSPSFPTVPSFDEMVLNVNEEHSDHEEHEPDEEGIGFSVHDDDEELHDIQIVVPVTPI